MIAASSWMFSSPVVTLRLVITSQTWTKNDMGWEGQQTGNPTQVLGQLIVSTYPFTLAMIGGFI